MAMFESLTGYTLRDPALLLVLGLVPLALWIGLRRGAPAVRFAPGGLFDDGGLGLPRTWRVRWRSLPRVLQVLGIACVVLAFARPAEREALPQRAVGLDILLCLDTSSSMSSRDMDQRRTRLDVARDAAARFIEGRPHDRIGLITFARFPDVRCPLTLDHEALTAILGEVRPVEGEGPEDATGIGTAVARAAQVFEAGASPSRVVILLTDGVENVALQGKQGEIPPTHAAQLCERLGVRVYGIVAGVGRRAADGSLVALDTQAMQDMALRTGGTFHRARDADAVDRVYERIDQLETSALEEPRYVLEDRYLPFLILGLVLLALGLVLGATVFEVLP
ncbi:MAG: VWA domain-containing protein [Planctomycetota bacterium]|nr:VWA domain-containing protein [Planctomycetota bacterium]